MATENRLWSRRRRQSGRHLEVKIIVVFVVVVGSGDDGYDEEEDCVCGQDGISR